MTLRLPELSLVLLIGPSGSGKSTFARKHFKPTEVISSDLCRGMVSDDENDQSVTPQAFELVNFILRQRLALGRFTVVDATNLNPEDRAKLVAIAREFHVLPAALVFKIDESLCHERNALRPDRDFGPHVVKRQFNQLRRGLKNLKKEGFRHVVHFRSPEDIDAVEGIERQPLWNNRKEDAGPFDIIYGPEYDAPENLVRLKQRVLGHKRSMAEREFVLGVEALDRFTARRPLREVHECVLAVLAMESEPVDPRL